jgi:hypothetical protein
MNFSSRKIAIVVSAGAGLLVVRAALPAVLTWLANLGVQKVPGYRRVSVDFTTPRLVGQGLSLAKLNGGRPKLFLDVSSVVVGSHWKDIFTGSLIGYIRLDSPRLLVNLERIPLPAGNRGGSSKPYRDAKPSEPRPWQKKVEQLPAFRISSAALTDGEVRLQGISGQDGADIRIDRINLFLDNVTNSTNLAPSLMAKALCRARVMANGNLQLRAEGYPLSQVPTFNLDFQTRNVDLTEVRSLIEKHIEIYVHRGIVDLFIEAAAANGYIQGYAKPIFDHLELEPPRNSSFTACIKAWAAEPVVKLGKNKPKDRIATRLDFRRVFGRSRPELHGRSVKLPQE